MPSLHLFSWYQYTPLRSEKSLRVLTIREIPADTDCRHADNQGRGCVRYLIASLVFFRWIVSEYGLMSKITLKIHQPGSVQPPIAGDSFLAGTFVFNRFARHHWRSRWYVRGYFGWGRCDSARLHTLPACSRVPNCDYRRCRPGSGSSRFPSIRSYI